MSGLSEFKFVDTVLGPTAVSSSGTLLNESICLIAEGAGSSQRAGSSIKVRAIHVNGAYAVLPTTTLASMRQQVRIMVVVDKEPAGAALSVADVYNTGGAMQLHSLRGMGEFTRFEIVYDRMFEAGVLALDSMDSCVPVDRGWTVVSDGVLPVEYSGSGATIADLEANNIAVLAVCATGGVGPSVRYVARVYFTDA